MFHLRNKSSLFFAVIAILFVSCGFVDLRPVEVAIMPGKSGVVLPEKFSPVSVSFNTEMVQKEAESLLTISHDNGLVDGDLFWNGNTLLFVPVAGWKAGTMYRLTLSGTARTTDGREIRLERYISFYSINNFSAPVIEWHSPADGESVRVNGLTLEIRFSCGMDKASVETSLTADSMGEKKFEWSDDNKTVRIIPERNLSPWTVYRWTLGNGAQSIDGVHITNTVSAVFCTDFDRETPKVSRVFPVLQSGGQWIPTGGSLEEGFGAGLGVAVEFSKPMDDAATRSLRFEPSLSGRVEKLSETKMVFIPSRDPEPETVYTLIISGDAKDMEGLKIGSDYRRAFTADIPYLQILSIKTAEGKQSEWNSNDRILQVQPAEVDGLVRITIHFSLPFIAEAKQKTTLAISLLPFFPSNLGPVALRFVTWHSDDRLTMEWERLSGGTEEKPHFYRLLLPGGRGGIDNGGGMFLKNEISIYVEAIE